METMRCIVDGHNGIYTPQTFCERFNMEEWNLKGEDEAVLSLGPENEDYLDTWNFVLNAAFYTDENGERWTLYQGESGDLFAVHESHQWEE